MSDDHTTTYFLFFHEQSQSFKIIPVGVTITEAHDGVPVYHSEDKTEVEAIGRGLIASKAWFTASELKERLRITVAPKTKEG